LKSVTCESRRPSSVQDSGGFPNADAGVAGTQASSIPRVPTDPSSCITAAVRDDRECMGCDRIKCGRTSRAWSRDAVRKRLRRWCVSRLPRSGFPRSTRLA